MNLRDIGFDFEEMARLANADPDEFARRREQLIRRLIANSPHKKYLADVQMDLDAVRYRSSPGISAAEQMANMMRESSTSMTKHMATLKGLIEAK